MGTAVDGRQEVRAVTDLAELVERVLELPRAAAVAAPGAARDPEGEPVTYRLDRSPDALAVTAS